MEDGEFYEGGAVRWIELLFMVTKDHMSERKLEIWSFFSVKNGV